ncbi:MAG: hypothetical protein GY750_19320 [Lentisphaerae bacterium]|nr:hypothetical protein [Lentisphaerota bacterium]MCP4103549.1 hypothetical protein [Lentisphaerota bacterium]
MVTKQRLIRTAIQVVLPNGGIDPTKIVKSGLNEGNNTPPNTSIEKRIGQDVDEINLRGFGIGIDAGIADLMNFKGTFAGTLENSWVSFPNMFSKVGISGNTALKKSFRELFIIASENTKEAYHITEDINGNGILDAGEDDNGNGILDAGEDDNGNGILELKEDANGNNDIDENWYHRFNLARTQAEWNTLGADVNKMYEDILLDMDHNGVPDVLPEVYSGAGTDTNGKGIPWLAFWGYKTDGNVDTDLGESFGKTQAGVIARRRQIAANLVDYYDDDSNPTSDVANTAWLTNSTPPSFIGNEKTPYINEIGLRVEALAFHGSIGGGARDVYAILKFYPAVELINMYDDDWNSELKVKVTGTVNITVKIGGNPSNDRTQDYSFTEDVTVPAAKWSSGYSNFIPCNIATVLAQPSQAVSITMPANTDVTVVVNSVKITNAVLYSGANVGYDYVSNIADTSLGLKILDAAGESSAAENAWFGYAVHDPRQNLNDQDWKRLVHSKTPDPSTVLSIGGGAGYPGMANYNKGTDFASAGADKEQGNEVANNSISTAKIANRPIISPWELGLISRGAKFETLNLSQYDKTKA